MTIKWIISDVDGCLSSEDSVPFDQELFANLARLSRDATEGRGKLPPLALCTGRPQPYVELLMKMLHIKSPAICENGAVFYSLAENRAWFGPGVTGEKIAGLRRLRSEINARLPGHYPTVHYQFGKEAQLSYFAQDTAPLADLKRDVEALLADGDYPPLNLTYSVHYLNISLADVHKGRALEELMRILGVARGEVAGVGDTIGDLPLREYVGYFACPANAVEEIKAVADYVSPFDELRGVLDLLEKWNASGEPPRP